MGKWLLNWVGMLCARLFWRRRSRLFVFSVYDYDAQQRCLLLLCVYDYDARAAILLACRYDDASAVACLDTFLARIEAYSRILPAGFPNQLSARYDYDNISTPPAAFPTAGRFPRRFSTKYLDTDTGLYYYAPRYYTPELGRRPSRDPIGEGAFRVVLGDEARKHPITVAGREYRFVRNDPVANVDIKGVSTLSKKQNGKSKGFECDIKSSTKKFCKLCFIGRSHLIAGVCTGCQRLCYQWCIDQFNNDPFNILPINFVELCGADCSARAAVCVASRCKLKFNP